MWRRSHHTCLPVPGLFCLTWCPLALSIFSSQMMILTFVDEWCSAVRCAVFPLPIIGWQTLGLFSFIASVHRPQKYVSANVSLEKKQHFCLLRIFFNRGQSEIYRIIDNIKKEMNFHVQQKETWNEMYHSNAYYRLWESFFYYIYNILRSQ